MPTPIKKNIAIIGSGIGGLCSAILLAKDGYTVDVYEKNECLGGRASILNEGGFRFDMGPSRYLMPEVFEQFYASIGENISDHLPLHKLAPSYRIFFEDQTFVDIYGDIEKDKHTIEALEPGSMQKFLDYIKTSSHQYHIGMKFVRKNYDSIWDFLNWDTMIEGSKINVFSSLDTYVRKSFNSPKVQKILQYPLVFLGTSPYDAPALYNIMSHVDFCQGVFYPQGGIYSLIQSLEKIGKKYGVTYHCNTAVSKINIDKTGQATSMQIQEKEISIDGVVCNADMARAETNLLDVQRQTHKDTYRQKRTFAPSGYIIYLGLNKRFDDLPHHTLLFCDDWETSFGSIFGPDKKLPENPSIYICRPSSTDETVAPAGHDNRFILVPAPSGITLSDQQIADYKALVYKKVSHYTGHDITPHIVYEKVFTSNDFATRYNARDGTALGLSHTLRQTALLRPNNVSEKVDNLFYVGHTTNPGIGMPMVMISAELVQERVKQREKKKKK